MIYIQKDKEPDEIVSWKKKFKNKNKRKPCYEDIKSKPEKQQLKEAIEAENFEDAVTLRDEIRMLEAKHDE